MKLCLCFCVVLAVCGTGIAASPWESIGPWGGSIGALVPDRNTPGLWFALNQSRLYRSEDDGLSWQRVAGIEYASKVYVRHDSTVQIEASEPWGFWESRDRGKTFSQLALYPRQDPRPNEVVFDPYRRSVIYGFDRDSRFVRSTNSGRTWKFLKSAPRRYCYHDVLVSPHDRDTLFLSGSNNNDMGCSGPVLLSSTDNGGAWTVVAQSSPTAYDSNLYLFHTDPAFPGRAFVYNSESLLRITKKGLEPASSVRFLSLLASVPGQADEFLAVQRLEVRYGGDRVSLLRSTDAGRSWAPLKDKLRNTITAIAATGGRRLEYLAGTDGAGVYRRRPGGSWRSSGKGLREPLSILHLAGSGNKVYAMAGGAEDLAYGRFLYRSDDAGDSWRNLTFTFFPRGGDDYTCCVRDLAVNPKDASHVLIAGMREFFTSTDAGSAWTRLPRIFQGLAFDAAGRVYAVEDRDDGAVLVRSADGGRTFRDLSRLPVQSSRIVIDPANLNTVFVVAFTEGVFRSTDGGATFRRIWKRGYANEPMDMAALAEQGAYVLLTGDGEIHRTSDYGSSWKRIGRLADALFYDSGRIIVVDEPGHHLISLLARRLFESFDGGESWSEITSDLPMAQYAVILTIATDGQGQTYAGTSEGVYRK